MLKYCNRRFLIIAIALCLVGCVSKTVYVPVSNAWLQSGARYSSYRVKRGDTLYSIAWAFGIDYRALARVNHLKPPYTLKTGQTLSMTNIPWGRRRSANQQQKIVKLSHHALMPSPRWRWPSNSRRIVRRYDGKPTGNQGIDIGGRLGSPIYAASTGVVVYSGAGIRGYGNLIIIKHNASYLSAYAYNQRNCVVLGQRVLSGQKIALMGKNNASSVRLHFEIRRNGRPVNPLAAQFLG